MDKFIIYCDGGCRGNQEKINIGGWGAFLQYKDNVNEIYGGVRNTTNNKMELLACIEALKAIHGNKDVPVEIHCDSAYVVNGMNSWVAGWIKNGWKNSKKKPVENQDLWKKLLALSNSHEDIKFIKVKGHADNEGNIRADALVNQAMDEMLI
ncbi:ribonuclease HI [Viridibacillus arvi]|uniref:ribonuclease HI n=1 Tax=Viridibacillus arvi TaxID=263475 RepID=UPI0034CEA868